MNSNTSEQVMSKCDPELSELSEEVLEVKTMFVRLTRPRTNAGSRPSIYGSFQKVYEM